MHRRKMKQLINLECPEVSIGASHGRWWQIGTRGNSAWFYQPRERSLCLCPTAARRLTCTAHNLLSPFWQFGSFWKSAQDNFFQNQESHTNKTRACLCSNCVTQQCLLKTAMGMGDRLSIVDFVLASPIQGDVPFGLCNCSPSKAESITAHSDSNNY